MLNKFNVQYTVDSVHRARLSGNVDVELIKMTITVSITEDML